MSTSFDSSRWAAPLGGFGLTSMLCPLLFADFVYVLQSGDPSYDGHTQLMSELALVPGGYGLMRSAFWMLALGSLSLSCCFGSRLYIKVPFVRSLLRYLLILSTVSFMAAGLMTLERAPTLHTVSIFIAFVALAVSMWVVFRQKVFGWFRWFSLAALLFALAALSFGNIGVLEAGTAQRMTALGVLGWMFAAGVYFSFFPHPSYNDSHSKSDSCVPK